MRATVTPAELDELATWTTPDQRALFASMHRADRRHGLDVVASLRATGSTDPELLLAGLLHDAGKGRTGIWPRVVYSLGERYGTWVWRVAAILPGMRRSLVRLRLHAETSAALAARAGCSSRTQALIRDQAGPTESVAGRSLRIADDAN